MGGDAATARDHDARVAKELKEFGLATYQRRDVEGVKIRGVGGGSSVEPVWERYLSSDRA